MGHEEETGLTLALAAGADRPLSKYKDEVIGIVSFWHLQIGNSTDVFLSKSSNVQALSTKVTFCVCNGQMGYVRCREKKVTNRECLMSGDQMRD